MKIFLDTANLEEIREAAALGVVDGVTTNPSLLARETGDPEEILVEICKTVNGPISGEVVATEADEMIEEGRHLASLHENIVVKIPCIWEGLKATKVLSGEGKRINGTAYATTSNSYDRQGNVTDVVYADGREVHVFTTNVDGAGTSNVPVGEPVSLDGVMVSYFSPYKGATLREMCEELGYVKDDEIAMDYRLGPSMDMPQLSAAALRGLHRTFPLYVKFPESEWDDISLAERDTPEGIAAFEAYSQRYTRQFMS